MSQIKAIFLASCILGSNIFCPPKIDPTKVAAKQEKFSQLCKRFDYLFNAMKNNCNQATSEQKKEFEKLAEQINAYQTQIDSDKFIAVANAVKYVQTSVKTVELEKPSGCCPVGKLACYALGAICIAAVAIEGANRIGAAWPDTNGLAVASPENFAACNNFFLKNCLVNVPNVLQAVNQT